MHPRRALVIGIDQYQDRNVGSLKCCARDAQEVARLLLHHDDGKSNFDVRLLTDPAHRLANHHLEEELSKFFRSSQRCDVALLYFAGHGHRNRATGEDYLVGSNGAPGAWGVPLSGLLRMANEAAEKSAGSVVIILDCCHAGAAGKAEGEYGSGPSIIGPGITILASCNEDETAQEQGQHGTFTSLLLEALAGGCADIRGHITPASIYSHIDQVLGGHEQRPLYKANVQRFVSLREVKPWIPPEVLRKLPEYFRRAQFVYELDHTYESDRVRVAEQYRGLPTDPRNIEVFEHLKMFNRRGLVDPCTREGLFDRKRVPDMFTAAMDKHACRLTPLGQHYCRLAEREAGR